MADKLSAVVAGHICVDIFPGLETLGEGKFDEMFHPGGLITVGPAILATGGPVSNTGLALHLLGISTRLIARVGDDPFGGVVQDLVEQYSPELAHGLVVVPGETTSYTIVISPPGQDRFFFHCHGANDVFCAEDVDFDLVARASLFHFGYPPIMQRMYRNGGVELAEVLRRAKATGVTTSMDMAALDPTTESGQIDWVAVFRAALPFVDIFMPSFEETLYALRRADFDRLKQSAPGGSLLSLASAGLLGELSSELLEMGAKIVGLKLGDRGLYLRTAGLAWLKGLGRAGPVDLAAWACQELWAPCFQVRVVGTTGSGDATIAGFLGALLRDFSPRQAVTAAVAVGACNVEAADALSGLRPWNETLARIQAGWSRLPMGRPASGWEFDRKNGLWARE
jgi:sugar/nucleoside kinase (ribokinase family)